MKKNGDISLKYELVFNKKKQLQERNRRPQMREEPLMTHDQMVTKWMENPDFWKAVSELNAQYADLDETLSKRKTKSQVQSGTTRKVNRSAAEIHRLENPRSSTGTNFSTPANPDPEPGAFLRRIPITMSATSIFDLLNRIWSYSPNGTW